MTVLQLSIRALPVILTIVMVRTLALHRVPKRTFLVLWGLALFALLVPAQLHLPLPSISPPWNELKAPMPRALPVAPNGIVITDSSPVISGGNNMPAVIDAKLAAIPWVQIIWAVAAGSMAVYFVGNHIRYRLRYRFAVPCEDENVQEWLLQNALRRRRVKIKVLADISTVLTYGVFRPVILLPKATDWKDRKQMEYVLLHEMTHIRHYDAIWKWCLCAALCVHWYNPLVWVMFILANRDLELICDESVLKAIGAAGKSEYARTLIGLAEKQIKITQFGMAFSKNAIEERILAIMKTKKVSWLATILAVTLIIGVTAGFTVASGDSPKAAQDDLPNVVQVTGESMVISCIDPKDGKTYYSWDSGITWTPMTEEEFDAASTLSDVEWWTAEDYAAWLEEEKEDLRSMIGERGWTPSAGWFTWDQQMVDEAIALHEQTLKDIQNGLKVSKPTVDGDTMVMFSYDENAVEVTTESGLALGFSTAADEAVDLAEYAPFGLITKDGKLFFNGKAVSYFTDRVEFDGMAFVRYNYWDQTDGGAFIHTVRQPTQNPDGSTDPFGELVEIEEYKDSETDDIVLPELGTAVHAAAMGNADNGGTTFADRFAKYTSFGITYEEAKNASGRGNVYLNGQLVNRFADVTPDGGVFSISSADQGGINVKTVYDGDGRLVGVEPVKK